MPLVPSYLVPFIIVLVVLPSIAAIRLRLALHQHLLNLQKSVRELQSLEDATYRQEEVKREKNQQERALKNEQKIEEWQKNELRRSALITVLERVLKRKPEIIKKLILMFTNASWKLEQVNTAALIDQVYSQEKIELNFILFRREIRCEQIDYFSRILPNLLLAFGLFGTFLGITINLIDLNQTINQLNNASDISNFLPKLQKPIQGMGIAFTTSLTGLGFSVVLTVVNFIFNTSLAKYQLISSLEDYLDNVYQPTLDGHTRLDKAVNRMVDKQHEFLNNFGTTVRDVVTQSLGGVAQQIAQGNIEATALAKQVYERFTESSGTIARAATDFQDAAVEMKTSAEIFKNSQFPQRLSQATVDLAKTQSNFSQSSAILANTVQSIEIALIELQSFSKNLVNVGQEITSINQISIRVLDLHQNNQQSLHEIIPQLQQGAQSFQLAIETLDKLQKRIVVRVDSLDKVQVELNQLVTTLNKYTEQVNLEIQALSYKFVESIDNQTEINKNQSQLLVENIQQFTNHTSATLANTVQSIEMTMNELHRSSQHLVKLGAKIANINQTSLQVLELHQSNQQSFGEMIPQFQQGAQSFQSAVTTLDKLQKQIVAKADSLDKVQVELTQLVATVRNYTEGVSLGIQSLGDRLVEGISNEANSNNAKFEIIVAELHRYISHLNDKKDEIFS